MKLAFKCPPRLQKCTIINILHTQFRSCSVSMFSIFSVSLKVSWVAIATPWILSLSFRISIFILNRFRRMPHPVVLVFVIICLTAPFLIKCFSYLAIWRKRRMSHENVRSFRQNKEARFSRTIFLVTTASFMTWIPFLYLNVEVYMAVGVSRPISFTVLFFTKLLPFSNSFANFVIYIIRFPSYRKALFSLCRFSILYSRPVKRSSVRNLHLSTASRSSGHLKL